MPTLMRKLCLSFILPLLMLLTQMGALQHELSHLHHADAPTREHKQLGSTEQACDICLAFAQLGSGARAQPFILQLAAGQHVQHALPSAHDAATTPPARRNRDPPCIA